MTSSIGEVKVNIEAEPGHGGSAKAAAEKDAKREEYQADEHHMTFQQLIDKYTTHIDLQDATKSQGITEEEAKDRLVKYGMNQLTPPAETPEIIKFLRQFLDGLMLLLQFAGCLCFVAMGLLYAANDPTDAQTDLILGVVLFGIVFLNCIMTYLQERAAGSVMARFKNMLPAQCTVIRGGKEQRIQAVTLVIGDICRLQIGDKVPADIRMIFSNELKVECSSLTGEPDAIAATVEKQHDTPAEAKNLIFNSSLCMNGEGYGVVIRTGDNTMIGKIAALATETHGNMSTLQLEILEVVKFIVVLGVLTAIVYFAIGLGNAHSTRKDFISDFVNAFILVIIANVPEGLPATVTTCLTIVARTLSERHVFIKKTDIVESLGSASVIASDKTGTLTQNRMTATNIYCNKTFLTCAELTLKRRTAAPVAAPLGRASAAIGVRPSEALRHVSKALQKQSSSTLIKQHGDLSPADSINNFSLAVTMGPTAKSVEWGTSSPIVRLATLASVCNRARFEEGQEAVAISERKTLGDASDTGLLRFSESLFPVSNIRQIYPVMFEIPFNSVNKWAYTVVRDPGDPSKHVAMLKGAPEIILTHCTHWQCGDDVVPVDDAFKRDYMVAYETFGSNGERVLGFSYRLIPAHTSEEYKADDELAPKDGFVFCGLISLMDPPREGVADAVAKCRSASIRVTMVTGDHPLTAEAIARKVGIVTLPTLADVARATGEPVASIDITDERVRAVVLHGQELKALEEADWDVILGKEEVVFARTSPQQKLQIVENYQRLGEVVAVTGDGVNDSPALKRAQIGVAMGSPAASDVAREAADIILLDDNFASIVGAIEEGRNLFDNLKKSTAYTLAHLWPELTPIFLNLAFQLPLGLPGLILLTVDLVTEQGPAVSLAYERPEASIMDNPPRNVKTDRLITWKVLAHAYLFAGVVESCVVILNFLMLYQLYGISSSDLYFSSSTYWAIPATLGTGYNNASPPPPPFPPNQSPPPGSFNTSPCINSNYFYAKSSGKCFSPDDQWSIYTQSVSAVYNAIVMSQFWHIWMCKTRTVSIFKHGLFKNLVTVYGLCVTIVILIIVIYIPGLQTGFFTANLPGQFWLPNLLFLVVMLPWTEYTKYMARTQPDSMWVKYVAW